MEEVSGNNMSLYSSKCETIGLASTKKVYIWVNQSRAMQDIVVWLYVFYDCI